MRLCKDSAAKKTTSLRKVNDMLSLKGIKKAYGNKTVLNGVDLSVSRGETVMISGESGCGKSTLLNIIGLLDSFDSGEYIFENKRIDKASGFGCPELRGVKIGFVFQSYFLIESLNALDNTLMPFLYNGKPINKAVRNRAHEYFEAIGLAGVAQSRAVNLSGGEKQRVAIIRALLSEPELIIADEPTGNLDSGNTEEVIKLLKEYAKADHAVLVVSHNKLLKSRFDRNYSLYGGVLHDE